MFLVTLPVLLGVPASDLSPNLTHVAQIGKQILAFFKQTPAAVPESAKPATTAAEPTPAEVDDVRLLDRASQDLLAQIERTPDDPSLYNQVGLIYAGGAEYDKAVVVLQKAIEVARVRMTRLTELEQQCRNSRQYDRAAKMVVERSKIGVELAAAHSSLARVYDELGQHDRVVPQLEQLNNDIAFGTALGGNKIATAMQQPGIGAASAANHKMAPQVMSMLAHAEALMQARRVPEATLEYKRVLQLDPLAALAHERLGMLAAMSNNCYLAIQELETAQRLDPSDAAVANTLALAYQSRGEPEKAIAQFEKALALNPKSADAAFNLGNILCAAGRVKQAQEAYRRAAELSPNLAIVHN
ncbi:MAG: tetratricopeptide repeat protein, partial [Terriglobales bacterium]